MRKRYIAAIIVTLAATSSAFATEPNETFATSTVLSPGVLSVSDELGDSGFDVPDTVLGVRDHFGTIYATDDDSSPLGDGRASGLFAVPTNSGAIDFAISGYPDFDFDGSHSEQGSYEVFVDVYDFFGDLVDEFSAVRLLQPGIVHDFFYSDSEWIGGEYDVYIDNLLAVSDVDFFRFTGLTPGAAFTATTVDPNDTNLDTYLGWFDGGGALLAANDDIDPENEIYLSSLGGVVPASGTLTFAVTGYGDEGFVGEHSIFGDYELQLDIESAGLSGDYNDDGTVDAADYVVWRKNVGTSNPLPNDPNGGTIGAPQYTTWRANFGSSSPGSGSGDLAAVPEPAGALLLAIGIAALCGHRPRTT